MNTEIITIIISVATLIATIVACVIASQIAKRSARYTVHHYINTTVIRWVSLMEEVTTIKELPDSTTNVEWVNRIHYDSVEIQNIGMALALEAGGNTFLKKKQLLAMDNMLFIGRDFWRLETKEQRHECIDNIYRALEIFNNFSKKEMEEYEKMAKEMEGGKS
ncbi:MAG: hypothetical protein MJZ86_10490 [Bacteroidales bacterium]|nr:hypothetical protein [Bacteroidales bacterium]